MAKGNSSRGQNGHQLASLVRASAHEIWLAGLGAYTRAGKEGTRLFESLVELGEAVERKAKDQVARPFRVAERRVDTARSAVNDTWERIGLMLERRVMKTLHALQIPTQRDVAELTERVERLQAAVEELTRAAPVADKASTRTRKKARAKKKAAPRKPRAKTRARKPRGAART